MFQSKTRTTAWINALGTEYAKKYEATEKKNHTWKTIKDALSGTANVEQVHEELSRLHTMWERLITLPIGNIFVVV